MIFQTKIGTHAWNVPKWCRSLSFLPWSGQTRSQFERWSVLWSVSMVKENPHFNYKNVYRYISFFLNYRFRLVGRAFVYLSNLMYPVPLIHRIAIGKLENRKIGQGLDEFSNKAYRVKLSKKEGVKKVQKMVHIVFVWPPKLN